MGNPKPLSELISLEGKQVLITGSAVGIGRAMALRFVEAGANLDLVDIDEAGLTALDRELARFGRKVHLHRVDLSRKEEIDNLWANLRGRTPDILVNNAGWYPFKKLMEVDEAFFRKVMDTNLSSAFCPLKLKPA